MQANGTTGRMDGDDVHEKGERREKDGILLYTHWTAAGRKRDGTAQRTD